MAAAPVIVVGAGIGGLAAAIALTRAGRRVLTLERAEKIEEVGAGLQISPNAGRVLQEFGLSPALEKIALEPHALDIRRAADGATLARLPLAAARSRWGAPFRVFHRADLQNALLEKALSLGATVRTGVRCSGFSQDEDGVRLIVHSESGEETLDAEAVIGADGLRSSIRSGLRLCENDEPIDLGLTAWRALFPIETAPASLRERATHLWLGPGAHIVHYPLRDASIVSAVAIIEGATAPAESLNGEELARAIGFERWNADLRALIEAAPAWRRWPLFGRPELVRWSRGRVTLLGDAAHPMTPFLAQGAAQAIEDAAALGRAFEPGGQSVEAALDAYQAARTQRAIKIQRGSRRQGFYFHMSGPAAVARDLAIRALGGAGMLARNAWLYR
ncbi:MAG: salicylate 1-monooxygenase [Methylocystaceae bacterium]|nr:MAG: salicylate 1-monooxygenase [Methylocystaceae bacterium]